jgi:alpha-amylase
MRLALAFSAALLAAACGGDDAGPDPNAVTLSVSGVFPAGTRVRDAYAGTSATVAADGTLTIVPHENGVALLEREGATPSAFTWPGVTVYHVIVDRFVNGDPANDGSYGRQKDGVEEIGTWHGGDWKGLTSRLDHIASLGVTALWISPIVENVHGWAAGGIGDFKHYGYHGYWALDFTRLDANLGTLADLEALVDGAHQRGIRVLVDVVLNHPGYATGADLKQYLPEVFKDGTGAAFTTFDATETTGLNRWNDLVNYSSTGWASWWSPRWIRAGFPGFPGGGRDDLTMQLAFLPDFITEGTAAADHPVLFMRKTDTAFALQQGQTVRQHLVKWHTDWVREVGFDGFRVDTVKNVENATFSALKEAGTRALADWKAANPTKKIDDAPFYMIGEVFGHAIVKDAYYTEGGFDSIINFDFQDRQRAMVQNHAQLLDAVDTLEALYAEMAGRLGGDPTFGVLSYASSHDTKLNFQYLGDNPPKQNESGTVLLLAPGGVEIYYGDETGRRGGPTGSDQQQTTRSDMNFASIDTTILDHWTRLATFRKRHAAVGGGAHQRLESPAGTYAFSRRLGGDDVVVVLTRSR